MKLNNDCNVNNIGYLLYMQEQEKKNKTIVDGRKDLDLLDFFKTTTYEKEEK